MNLQVAFMQMRWMHSLWTHQNTSRHFELRHSLLNSIIYVVLLAGIDKGYYLDTNFQFSGVRGGFILPGKSV